MLILSRHRVRRYCWRSVHPILGVHDFCDSLLTEPILSFDLSFIDKLIKILKLPDSLRLHKYHEGISSFKFIEHRQHFCSLEKIGLREYIVIVFVGVGEIHSPGVY